MSIALAPLALVLAVTASAPDPSLGRDYNVGHLGWNGLSTLASLARDIGCPTEVRRTLDWSTLDGQDVLFFLYPQTAPDRDALQSFLSVGGRVILADDYGASENALRGLSITRRTGRFPSGTVAYRGDDQLPVATASRPTALGRSTPELVANHSAYFSSNLPSTFEFVSGAGLVIEGTLRRGRFVAVADPSIFINNMLELRGNREFTARLLLDMCRVRRDRLLLFYGGFAQSGQPPTILAGAPAGAGLSGQPEEWNRALAGANQNILESLRKKERGSSLDLIELTGIVFAISVLLLLLRYLPMPRAERDARFAQPPRPPETGLFASIARYAGGAGRAVGWGYVYPATLIREEVLARLQPFIVAAPRPITEMQPAPAAVAALVRQSHGERAGELTELLLEEFSRLQPKTDASLSRGRGLELQISERSLRRYYEKAVALFALLERRAQKT
jgi:hypothetical protein